MKRDPIHEKAIRLIEGGQVDVDCLCVRMKTTTAGWNVCMLCNMDSICVNSTEMNLVCRECDDITGKNCYLELVSNDNLIEQ